MYSIRSAFAVTSCARLFCSQTYGPAGVFYPLSLHCYQLRTSLLFTDVRSGGCILSAQPSLLPAPHVSSVHRRTVRRVYSIRSAFAVTSCARLFCSQTYGPAGVFYPLSLRCYQLRTSLLFTDVRSGGCILSAQPSLLPAAHVSSVHRRTVRRVYSIRSAFAVTSCARLFCSQTYGPAGVFYPLSLHCYQLHTSLLFTDVRSGGCILSAQPSLLPAPHVSSVHRRTVRRVYSIRSAFTVTSSARLFCSQTYGPAGVFYPLSLHCYQLRTSLLFTDVRSGGCILSAQPSLLPAAHVSSVHRRTVRRVYSIRSAFTVTSSARLFCSQTYGPAGVFYPLSLHCYQLRTSLLFTDVRSGGCILSAQPSLLPAPHVSSVHRRTVRRVYSIRSAFTVTSCARLFCSQTYGPAGVFYPLSLHCYQLRTSLLFTDVRSGGCILSAQPSLLPAPHVSSVHRRTVRRVYSIRSAFTVTSSARLFCSQTYGPAGVFYPLSLHCYQLRTSSYRYTVCPFHNATQRKTATSRSLGTVPGWLPPQPGQLHRLRMSGGASIQCPESKARVAVVSL